MDSSSDTKVYNLTHALRQAEMWDRDVLRIFFSDDLVVLSMLFFLNTPWKINMEHNHRGLVQIIFLSFYG